MGKSINRYSLASFTIILFLLLASPYAAWPASDDELLEGAKNEGKLSIYHSPNVSGYVDIIRKFKERYPFIGVESLQASASRLLIRILAEDKAKKYIPDIIDTRGFGINIMKEKGLLIKYASPNFRFIPPEFIDPEGYYWANCVAVQSVAYNTRVVLPNDAPKSLDDLLNPRWKGKLFLDDGDYEWYGNMLSIMGREKGLEFMKKLSKQNIQFRFGKLLMANLVAAGEIPVFLTASGHTMEQLREKGAPVKWVPIDPLIGQIGSMGITSHAAHPNAAKLFVNFLSSKEGQELISNSFGKNPTRVDTKHRYPNLDVKGRKLFVSSVTVDYSKYDKEFRTMFNR